MKTKTRKTKRRNKIEQNIQEQQDIYKRYNMLVMEIPEREKRKKHPPPKKIRNNND